MKNLAIVTDTASGITREFAEAFDIKVLPMTVIIDGVAYRESIDATTEEIYEKLAVSGEGAKTSQPTIGEFIEVYEEIEQDSRYDAVIAIHASSELTGTYQSSLSASQECSKPVSIIDSSRGSYPLYKMIEAAIESRETDESLEQLTARIEEMSKNSQLYILPKSFNQLRKSGRVSASQSMLATLLNIQLQLEFDGGKIVIGEKVRTKRKMSQLLLSKLEHHIDNDGVKTIAILYAGAKSLTDEWASTLKERFNSIELVFQPFVPVAGVHTGHGTVAFGYIKNM